MTHLSIYDFIKMTVVFTAVMLIYVHQNVAIVRLGYEITEKQTMLSKCLDQHRKLVYHLNKLESPMVLSKRVAAIRSGLVETDIKDICYAKVNYKEAHAGTKQRTRVMDKLLDSLAVKAEAKARK